MGLVLATYNVLDLFDASDGARIERLASRLRPHAPDVVALQEVGGEEAAAAFARALGAPYEIVLGDADDRGIRCALLARHRVIEKNVLRAEHLPFPRFEREDPEPFASRIPLRRSIPDVVVDVPNFGRVRVLVVHFKSRRGKPMRNGAGVVEPRSTTEVAELEARAVVWRSSEALFVRRAVDARLTADPRELLCVCGDFNDVPDSLPLRIVAGTAGTETDAPRADALRSCADSIPASERVSVDHDGEPSAIDHALVSPRLAARFSSASYLRSPPPDPAATSDHAPLVVRFL
jgi:endonuclease/exonuclease/phosphatase family metal-dependent hydrolase